MHGMAIMMRCNLSNLSRVGTPDKQIRVGVAFSTGKVKWLLAWHSMARVRYFNIKRSGENQVGVPKYSAGYVRWYAQTITDDARCKHLYECHIVVPHIFLIPINIKFVANGITGVEICNLQVLMLMKAFYI
jgi:hypothetical protein